MDRKSIWELTSNIKNFSKINGNHSCDYLIIGGGITGITLAFLLSLEGKKGILVEAQKIGFGTTGKTTGKITCQHNLIYNQISSVLNTDTAKNYYEGNLLALDKIRSIITDYNIECDFEDIDTYVYSRNSDEAKEIEKEYQKYKQFNIKGELVTNIPINNSINAIKMNNQAQFHSLKYLSGLVDEIEKISNFKIYEKSRVNEISTDEELFAKTDKSIIKAKNIIMATNYPILKNDGAFILRIFQKRSYLLSSKSSSNIKNAFISYSDPTNTFRKYNDNLILGGFTHRVGFENNNYSKIHKLLGQYSDEKADCEWSTQDSCTIDSIPLIGNLNNGIFIATGYNKWGMTSSMLASLIIKDLLCNQNEISIDIKKVFDVNRINLKASSKEFFKHSYETFKTYSSAPFKNDDRLLTKNEGKVTKNDNKLSAVSMTEDGTMHVMDGRCPHLKCPLKFNEIEQTFDCKCHGSSFSMSGEIIYGPSSQNLDVIQVFKPRKKS